ncbi:hypothetical protein TRAPUB_12301 [Trametes pubescens]|uniref:Uncharacterized protein n=1 Tax=Trametes pubescens TaxID=154538 RepID=A0A1M2VUA9_TRAPU|nr:hypothetical protein TRAPUB_12301 [Trametes pubescens]
MARRGVTVWRGAAEYHKLEGTSDLPAVGASRAQEDDRRLLRVWLSTYASSQSLYLGVGPTARPADRTFTLGLIIAHDTPRTPATSIARALRIGYYTAWLDAETGSAAAAGGPRRSVPRTHSASSDERPRAAGREVAFPRYLGAALPGAAVSVRRGSSATGSGVRTRNACYRRMPLPLPPQPSPSQTSLRSSSRRCPDCTRTSDSMCIAPTLVVYIGKYVQPAGASAGWDAHVA